MPDAANLTENNIEQSLTVARSNQSTAEYIDAWATDIKVLWGQKPEVAINWIMVAAVVGDRHSLLEQKAHSLFSQYVDIYGRRDWVQERNEAIEAAEIMADDGSRTWRDQVVALYEKSRAQGFIESLNTADKASPETLLLKRAISCRDSFAYGLLVQLDIALRAKDENPRRHKRMKSYPLSQIRTDFGFV